MEIEGANRSLTNCWICRLLVSFSVARQNRRANVPACCYAKPSSAPDLSGGTQTFQVTHPFHSLRGREFTFVTYRHNWGCTGSP